MHIVKANYAYNALLSMYYVSLELWGRTQSTHHLLNLLLICFLSLFVENSLILCTWLHLGKDFFAQLNILVVHSVYLRCCCCCYQSCSYFQFSYVIVLYNLWYCLLVKFAVLKSILFLTAISNKIQETILFSSFRKHPIDKYQSARWESGLVCMTYKICGWC